MKRKIIFHFLFLLFLIKGDIISIDDSLYFQQIAFKSPNIDESQVHAWEDNLPFKATNKIEFDENNECFLSIDKINGLIYGSQRKNINDNNNHDMLVNPYKPWSLLKNIPNDLSSAFKDDDGYLFHTDNSFLFATSTNLYEFTIDYECNNVLSSSSLLSNMNW